MGAAARLFVFGACLTLATVSSAFAQQRGSIVGKVSDPDGLPLPGATVTVAQAATGFTRTTVTAETGAFSVPNLDPGTYTVTVEMPGFADLRRTDLVLTAGLTITLDLTARVAGVTEEVVVTGQSPLVEKTSNQIGGSLSRKEIEDVPSNFRNFTALTQLIPGITPNPAASTFEGGRVVANGPVAAERLSARRDVQQRRPPRRQPGHAGARGARQHRRVPGAVQPVQRGVRRRGGRDHQHGDPRRHQRVQRPRVHVLP
jgi:hypothetical protein